MQVLGIPGYLDLLPKMLSQKSRQVFAHGGIGDVREAHLLQTGPRSPGGLGIERYSS